MAIPSPYPPRAAAATIAALNAAIERSADVVRRARRRPRFLQRLGLRLPVTERDVKQAFYARAKLTHPDHHGSAAEFIQIQQAFNEAIEFARMNQQRLPWVARLMPVYVAQRRVAQWVELWGGRVRVREIDWLENAVGEGYAHLADRLVEIDLSGCRVGDKRIARLTAEPRGIEFVEVLRLRNTLLTDEGAAHLAQARNLKHLDLRGTGVSAPMQDRLLRLPSMVSVAGSSLLRQGWWRLAGR